VGAGQHDAAFHGGEHECGYGFQIETFRDAVAGLLQALFDDGGPVVEVLSDAFVEVALAIVNFEGELADERIEQRVFFKWRNGPKLWRRSR
jgi:hypothetical protein